MSPRIVERLIWESEKCQGFKSGVLKMSRVHEGSPRIVKRLRAESEKCQGFKRGVRELSERLFGEFEKCQSI